MLTRGCCLDYCVSVCRRYSSLLFVGACCLLAVVDDRCVASLFCAVGCYLLACVWVVRGCCCWPASLLAVSCGCVVRLCWLLGFWCRCILWLVVGACSLFVLL